ncbi:TPA: SEC10/PgrA surface exclusion domain-containing protein [Streptococcus suis]|nr:SEC10/PgrA surface exclusion domain-containing protein [Streptococcus suis]
MKKKFKNFAATTAFTLAAVGTPAFAEDITTVEATEATVTETTAVEAKSEVDTQKAVVDATATKVANAQNDATQATQEVSDAQADVDTATQAVKDAEANAANATPDNIAANQADQTANFADQAANATETDEVNVAITAQNQTVADAQTAVATAQADKDQADTAVQAAEATVQSAQDAISGTGLAEAQANLDQAKADVKTAQDNVATATTAVDIAKKADADRQTKIDAAKTDVAVKTDAVNITKTVLTKATDDVTSTTAKLTEINDAVKKATDALTNIDIETITIGKGQLENEDGTLDDKTFMDWYKEWSQNRADADTFELLRGSGVAVLDHSSVQLNEANKNETVVIGNLSEEQKIEINKFAAKVITAIRKSLDPKTFDVHTSLEVIKHADEQVVKYVERGESIQKWALGSVDEQSSAHIAHPAGLDNLAVSAVFRPTMSMYELKKDVFNSMMAFTFTDGPSLYGHMRNLVYYGDRHAVAFANIENQFHTIHFMQLGSQDEVLDTDNISINIEALKADQSQAQMAANEANAKLVKAKEDYATALEAKTQAEKVLADTTATPLQTQVAENNLRLATIALQNAEARKADAQKAVDNFSADLADKKAALATAKAELTAAQATASTKAEALKTAQANLASQQATLDSLNKERDALLAEKDRLVEEAKALAEELKGYLEAPERLADAKATLTEKQNALTDAQAKTETSQAKLEALTAKLAEEKAKLAELQAEYEVIKDLEDKAKDNVIATLPDGTVIAVSKDAPTAQAKPAIDIEAVKNALAKGQDVKVVDGGVVVTKPQAGVTITQIATGEKVTYSRVERAKALPNTGNQASLVLVFLGLTNLLGVAALRRNK